MAGYDIRKQNMEKAHGVRERDWDALIKTIDPKQGEKILDLMGGDGVVASKLYDYASKKGIGLSLGVMDAFSKQLERAPKHLERIVGDVRRMPVKSGTYDKIVVKMGFHELPLIEQQESLKEVYRTLKPKGKLVIWMVGLKNSHEQNTFHKFAREKDRIAGFNDFVENRYFPTKQQTKEYLSDANFTGIKERYNNTSVMNTYARLNGDFRGDKTKLENLNNYMRANFNEFKKYLGAKDLGASIDINHTVCIIKAEKMKGDKK